jgi:hypothetical protein
MVASANELYRIELVLWTPPAMLCVPVLARRVELVVTDFTI